MEATYYCLLVKDHGGMHSLKGRLMGVANKKEQAKFSKGRWAEASRIGGYIE